jgi:mono/diheme cytochrome c family protein
MHSNLHSSPDRIRQFVAAAALALAAFPLQAQNPAAPAAGGGRGGGGAAMSAAQTAMVTGIDSLVQAKLAAFTEARNALLQASLQLPADPATLRSRAEALAAAELALASARAGAFVLGQDSADRLSAAQVQTLVTTASAGGALVAAAPAAGGGGRAGGGGPQLSDPAYANFDAIFPKSDPVKAQTPEQELKEFILQPGYKMDLVLSERDDVKEPAAVSFDGNGRMFVLEIRGYMLTIDAQHQREPNGRISLHEDTNNDGVYDKHSVFVDNLVFPRFVTPFGPNAILTMETDQDELWKYTDTNNDGKADKKELMTTGLGRTGNVEHQQAFMTWTMDNWMYSTYNAVRVRWTPNGFLREATGSHGGQWGVTQDNDGKQWVQGGASGTPSYFQFPTVYGNINVGTQWDNDFTIPWGAPIRIADMQPGLSSVRMPDGTLNRVTGSAGNDIVRGHKMPADLQGEYLYGEPVARIVRRIHPTVTEGVTTLANAYKWNEFIKSTDPLFRPVDMATAPDGTVYIVDMYRGIIQESQWSAPIGTYLRARVDQYQLDKLHSMGRVWRLSYESLGRDKTVPRMNTQTAAQLVGNLSHPNGWWRDTAQQLLILKQDKSVVPALKKLVNTKENLLARFHALWTLEGLGALDAALTREMMKDAEPRMRSQAIRASETLYKGGDKSFAADYAKLAKDADVNVSIQALLTMNVLKVPDANTVAKAAQDANKARGVQVVANYILNPNAAGGGRGGAAAPNLGANQASFDRGQAVYASLCIECHGPAGLGAPKPDGNGTMAPALAGNPRVQGHRDYVLSVLLKGMTGPIPGTTFNDIMVPMGAGQTDQWVADVATYIRNSFGNTAPAVFPEQVAKVKAAVASRTTPWTFAELDARIPDQLTNFGDWTLTASSNPAGVRAAVTSFTTWSAQPQAGASTWFQIEMPVAANVAELQFNLSAGGGGRGGAGGRGGGAVAAAAPAEDLPVALPAVAQAANAAPAAPGARAFRIEVSANGTSWTTAAQAEGRDGPNAIALATTGPIKFVKITQTSGAASLAIGALRLFETPAAR